MISYGEETTVTFDPQAITFYSEQCFWRWLAGYFLAVTYCRLSKDCD